LAYRIAAQERKTEASKAAMNFTRVFPKIYIGSYPETPEDIDYLRRPMGVTAVLNLQSDDDLRSLDCDWAEMLAQYRRSRIQVRRVAVRDFDPEDMRKKMSRCVRALHELVQANHVVYVHCTAGVGRAPSVVITYLIWVHQCEITRAIQYVTSCRPCSPYVDAIRLACEDYMDSF
jgi:protein-tyrosine phosphatase